MMVMMYLELGFKETEKIRERAVLEAAKKGGHRK